METYRYTAIARPQPSCDDLLSKLRRAHRNIAQKTALVEEGRQLSYADLWRKVDRFTSFFKQQQLKKGQIVVIVCPMNSMEVSCLILALMQIEVVPFIINLTDKFQKLQPEDVQAVGLIIHKDIQKYLNRENQDTYSAVSMIEQGIWWHRRENDSDALLTDASLLVTSSGSTNRKKIIKYSREGMAFNIEKNIKALRIRPDDRTLMVLPLTYSYGLVAQFLSHLMVGATIVFSNKRLITNAIIELVSRHKITSLFTVPPIFRQLIFMLERFGDAYRKRYSWNSLRYMTVGGNHIESSSVRKALKLFACPIVKTYGLAEAGPRVATNWLTAESDPMNLTGRLLEGVKVEVLGPQGRILEDGRRGLLRIHTPSAALGYLYDSTNNLVIGGQQISTNDYGCLSPEGYLTLAGRKDHALDLKGLTPSIFKNDISDLLHSAFYLMKLQIHQLEGGRVRVDIAAMPGCKPKPEAIRRQLAERFGDPVNSAVELAFPRPGTIKIDK